MAKQRRTYPTREKSTAEKLSIVNQAHADVRNCERDIDAVIMVKECGGTTWGIGDPIDSALENYRTALVSRRALLERLESEYGTLEQLRAMHAGR